MPRKSVILNFRVTPETHSRLTDEAHSLGLSLSGLCSDRVLSRPVNLNLQANMQKILQGLQNLMTKLETLELALKGAQADTAAAQAVEADLRQQIKELQAGNRAKATNGRSASSVPATGGRRGMSPEGREAIRQAQLRRWSKTNQNAQGAGNDWPIEDPINSSLAAED